MEREREEERKKKKEREQEKERKRKEEMVGKKGRGWGREGKGKSKVKGGKERSKTDWQVFMGRSEQGEMYRMQIMWVDGEVKRQHSEGEKSCIPAIANLWAKINLSSLRCSCLVFCYNNK